MTEPLLLALDTSTRTASLALFDGAQVLSEITWLAGREHSTRLLVEVQLGFERVGRDPAQLTGLVVARGPGSFTGVRVALSVAKGIAGGFGIPAWGVSTLDILALAAGPSPLPVRALVEAGRGRYATALYVDGQPIGHATLATVSQLVELLTEETFLIGELQEDTRTTLSTLPRVRLASRAAGARRAGFLAELGWRMARRGEPGEARSLDAIYLT